MKWFFYLSLFTLLSSQGKAQSLSVVPHFPQSAYVVGRLLPFQVTGVEGVQVEAVEIEGAGCSGVPDPYYPANFHILCQQSGRFDILVRTQVGEEREWLVINNLEIGGSITQACEAVTSTEEDTAEEEPAAAEEVQE